MMELADMQDLGSCAARLVGSTPTTRTKQKDTFRRVLLVWVHRCPGARYPMIAHTGSTINGKSEKEAFF